MTSDCSKRLHTAWIDFSLEIEDFNGIIKYRSVLKSIFNLHVPNLQGNFTVTIQAREDSIIWKFDGQEKHYLYK